MANAVGRTAAALAALVLASSNASADWFPRVNEGGKLVITGVAVDPQDVSNAVYLTCKDDKFALTVLTLQNASEDDLSSYSGAKVIFASRNKEGDPVKFGADGEPVLNAGDILAIRTELTSAQSSQMLEFIARGQRVDVELVHSELTSDQGPKKVYSGGFTTALVALSKFCPKVR